MEELEPLLKDVAEAKAKEDAAEAKAEVAKARYEVEKAKTVAKLKLPKMATCVECHQGEVAFSYADCLKCHDKGIETRLLPASHPKPDKKK